MSLVRFSLAVLFLLTSSLCHADQPLIGYTEFQTDLPGGRHQNVRTMRAMVVHVDGTGLREIAGELVKQDDTWTQFAGWSPDGTKVIVGCGWQDPENAKWEEEHKRFRMDAGRWRYDAYLLDVATGGLSDVCAIDRVSHYNSISFSPLYQLVIELCDMRPARLTSVADKLIGERMN